MRDPQADTPPVEPREALLEAVETLRRLEDLPQLFHELAARLKSAVAFDIIGVLLCDSADNVMRLHILEADRALGGARGTGTGGRSAGGPWSNRAGTARRDWFPRLARGGDPLLLHRAAGVAQPVPRHLEHRPVRGEWLHTCGGGSPCPERRADRPGSRECYCPQSTCAGGSRQVPALAWAVLLLSAARIARPSPAANRVDRATWSEHNQIKEKYHA
jgi:hypothetical protein